MAAKTTRWATFFKYSIGYTPKPGAKHEMEGTYFKGGDGRASLASPLATTLVCVRNVRGGSGQDFSNSYRSGQKISPPQDSVVERQQH